LGLPRAAEPPGRAARPRGRAHPGAPGGLWPGAPAARLRAPGGAAGADPAEPGALRHQGAAGARADRAEGRPGPRRRDAPPAGSSLTAAPPTAMSGPRQLVDWHTHCYLPEHLGPEAGATLQARVGGAHAWPDAHRRGVVEGGADRFVVIKMPTRW